MHYKIKKHTPWLMWGLSALFYCYEFFLQVSPSVMVNDLMADLHVSAAALGSLTAFYLYAYGIMQIPVGMLLDRFGVRRLLTVNTLLCAIGSFVFGMANNFTMAAIGRLLIGTGSAFAVISTMHLAATWFPPKRFALLVGVTLTMGMLGAVSAQAPLSMLINVMGGWRQTLYLFGAFGFLLAIAIYAFVRDKTVSSTDVLELTGLFSGIKYIVRSTQMWLVSIYGGLIFLATPGFAGLWGVTFLMKAYEMSRTQAAFLVSFIFIGWAIGSPLFGWFSDYIGRRRRPLLIGAVGTWVCMTLILYIRHLNIWVLGTLLLAFGFFSSAFLPAFSIAKEINPPQANATALGFVNMLNSLGGAFAQLIIGFLLDIQVSGLLVRNIHRFTVSQYQWALSILPACLLTALLIIPFLKETHCQPQFVPNKT